MSDWPLIWGGGANHSRLSFSHLHLHYPPARRPGHPEGLLRVPDIATSFPGFSGLAMTVNLPSPRLRLEGVCCTNTQRGCLDFPVEIFAEIGMIYCILMCFYVGF